MMNEQRATMWCLFMAAAMHMPHLRRAEDRAKEADAALKEFDQRFNCPTCKGRGFVRGQESTRATCPTCDGEGGQQ